jgi:ABC-type Na+ efflux pump permease subunit
MDIIISVVVLLLLISTIVIVVVNMSNSKKPEALYGSVVFSNIEKADSPISFLQDYRVSESKLSAFKAEDYPDMKTVVFSGTQYSAGQELCIFFLNQSDTAYIDGSQSMGMGCSPTNPCASYVKSYVHVKPVLRQGDIMNMYIVICE